MSNTPIITALIPTYRRPDLLKRAIESVLTQTMPRIKVCVFDNASGDETAQVVAEIARRDPRVEYVCHPQNVGMTGNFNAALRSVETPYFAMLCDDDVVLPHFFETMLKSFERHPSAMQACGAMLFADNDASFLVRGPVMEADACLAPPDGLLRWRYETRPLFACILRRREIVDEIGVFSDYLMGDLEYELRIAARYPYAVCDVPCAVAISHDDSTSIKARGDVAQWWRNYELLSRCVLTLDSVLPEIREETNRILKRDLGIALFRVGMLAALRFGDLDAAANIAAALRPQYELPKEAATLERTIKLAQLAPLNAGLRSLDRVRTAIRQSKVSDLRQRVGRYLQNPTPAFSLGD